MDSLLSLKTSELLQKFGAGNAKPGSGSAAALLGVLSAQLVLTVISLSKDPKRAKNYGALYRRFSEIETEIRDGLLPNLERLFQEDSDQFATAIDARERRDQATDPARRSALAAEAEALLVPATEIPLEIARDCLRITEFALETFDVGFQSARGDSGVAINASLAGATGCISIVELNLLTFASTDWTRSIRKRRDELLSIIASLRQKADDRLSDQTRATEEHATFRESLEELMRSLKGRPIRSEVEIENLAIGLQRTIWINRSAAFSTHQSINPFETLRADKILKLYGYAVEKRPTLGSYESDGELFEVAGQIDQPRKIVSISKQFPDEVANFTAAHELGHALLHTGQLLHRDRPTNKSRNRRKVSPAEWQADRFATYFLMPSKLLRKTFTGLFETPCFEITFETSVGLNMRSTDELRSQVRNRRELARLLAEATFYHGKAFKSLRQIFNVSTEAMAIRLEELGLVSYE